MHQTNHPSSRLYCEYVGIQKEVQENLRRKCEMWLEGKSQYNSYD